MRSNSAGSNAGAVSRAAGEFSLDQLAELLRPERLHQDLDARLVDVVAAAFQVVDAQDRFEIREQILLRQELADHVADDRRAAEAAAHDHLEADCSGRVAHQVQADVVHVAKRRDPAASR